MNAYGTKITWVSIEDERDQRDRPGYAPVCCYGRSVMPERNEIGAICKPLGRPKLTDYGLWSTPCQYLERIFVVEPE